MTLGVGSGSGNVVSINPAVLYTPSGLAVSTSTITTNVAAGTNTVIGNGTQILNSTTPRINIQVNAGAAPDSSGKTMIQFEALVNNTATGYPTQKDAQVALLGVAESWGFANYALSTNTTSANCAILAW
jgi:hypothetical protein